MSDEPPKMNVEVSIKIEGIDAVDMAMLSDRVQEVFGPFNARIGISSTPIFNESARENVQRRIIQRGMERGDSPAKINAALENWRGE